MWDHHVLGFVLFLRFLWSQILCRLYKCPLDEYINVPPCVYTCKQIMYAHIKNPVVKSLVDYGNIHITQHALKASVFKIMKLDTIQKKKSMSPSTSLHHAQCCQYSLCPTVHTGIIHMYRGYTTLLYDRHKREGKNS